MPSSDVALVQPSSQNPFIQGISDLAGAIGGIAQTGANVYSTFLGAKTTADLAKAQKQVATYQPTTSQILSAEKRTNFLVYAGVGVAILGTVALIYKAVK